ncbi:erythroid membrane-associated protein-like [Lissotriton helveticus]
MASRGAQRRRQASSTGTSDAVSQDRAGREIPRLRTQGITLGVMVAVNIFINIVLFRLVERAVFYSPRVQSCAGLRDEAGDGGESSQNAPGSLLKTSLCLPPGKQLFLPCCQYNIHARQGSLPEQTCPRLRIEPGIEDSSSWRDLQPHLRETLCLHRALVSLDLDTASSAQRIYSKGRSVTWTDGVCPTPHSPKALKHCCCVLGMGVFNSGRHYWEVGVQEWWKREEWVILHRVMLGVGVVRVEREDDIAVSPEKRFWAVQQLDDGHYYPATSPLTRLSLRQPPLKLGLYLDYDGGLMSFYNADTWEHLYTFNDTFRGALHPFFQVEDPLIILNLV